MQFKYTPKQALALQKTLVNGDVEELFKLIGKYLDDNQLEVPDYVLVSLKKRGASSKIN